MGVVGAELGSAVQAGAEAGPELPAWIAAGDYILERVAGDFPDELVYVAQVGPAQLWIKSSNLIAGPWDWIVMSDGRPVAFEGPFTTRDEATADLAAYAVRTRLADPAVADLLSIPAADELPAAAESLKPRPAAPVPPSGVARPNGSEDEILALAIDMAISALRQVRSRYGAAGADARG